MAGLGYPRVDDYSGHYTDICNKSLSEVFRQPIMSQSPFQIFRIYMTGGLHQTFFLLVTSMVEPMNIHDFPYHSADVRSDFQDPADLLSGIFLASLLIHLRDAPSVIALIVPASVGLCQSCVGGRASSLLLENIVGIAPTLGNRTPGSNISLGDHPCKGSNLRTF